MNYASMSRVILSVKMERSGGFIKELPDELKNVPVEDMGDQLIIPGLTDLHVHAPQYSFRGSGNGYGAS